MMDWHMYIFGLIKLVSRLPALQSAGVLRKDDNKSTTSKDRKIANPSAHRSLITNLTIGYMFLKYICMSSSAWKIPKSEQVSLSGTPQAIC